MRFAATHRTNGQRLLAVFAAISMILSLMAIFATPAGADGEDSSAECTALAESVETGDVLTYTVNAPEGYVIDAVCIKSGDSAFESGDSKHSELITSDGPVSGSAFSVSGLGTASVTVTSSDKTISHIDYRLVEAPDLEPAVGTVAVIKKAHDDKSVEFTFGGDLSGSIAHDEDITIEAEVGVAYSATEVMTDGWYLDKITCEANGGQFEIDEALLTVSMTVTEEGGSVVCFFDNENLADSEGAIVVRKLVTQGSDTEQEFTFSTDDFTLTDNTLAHGEQGVADVNPGDYAVSETVPEGWELVSAVCESTDEADESTHDDIDISADEIVTCTFTNREIEVVADVRPEIGVDKSADAERANVGETVTFTVVISNPSATEPVKISSIVDSLYGALDGDDDCKVGVVLAAGASCEFTFTAAMTANDIPLHTNVVTVIGADVEQPEITVSASDNAKLEVAEVAGIVITPETPAGQVTPVTPLTPQVEAEQLPFTGLDSDRLLGLAIMLMGGGVLLLRWAPLREIDIIIED